jgi:putative aminopeptidase FrvX
MAKTAVKKRSTAKRSAVTATRQKPVITDESMDFLRAYINNPSPVGFESPGQKVWLNYIKPYVDDFYVDPYGTAVGIINPMSDFKVVIEAHADEISWFVNYITAEGLMYLKRNGGVDHQTAPASRVIIHGKKGPVKAVFGWPAIHTRIATPDQKEPAPRTDNLWLDCGARNRQEIEELGIHIGAVVTYQDGFDELANGNYIGRAFDNRIGGFMIAEVARILKENKK